MNKDDERLSSMFRMSSPDGVHAFLLAWHSVVSEAYSSGNYAAVDMLVDVAEAMDNADLSERERDVVDLVRRWDIVEVAGIVGVEVNTARTYMERGCAKIARYLEENGGYE